MAQTVAITAVVLVVLYILFVRWHRKWLDGQTPAGSWTATDGTQSVTLVFEAGPTEGTYKQLVESGGSTVREFGHWASRRNSLNMLIMATDVPEHPRLGIDTPYWLTFVGPQSICIDGPDRANLVFTRTADDIIIDFELEQEPE